MHSLEEFSFTRIREFLNTRKLGLAALAACFAIQSMYGIIYCKGGVTTFWIATLFAQIPAMAWLAHKNRYATALSAAVIQLFCLWANSMECKPYTGGGAAMAYVVVLLYGWPTATVLTLLTIWEKKPRDGA
jgi:hypothetical protein